MWVDPFSPNLNIFIITQRQMSHESLPPNDYTRSAHLSLPVSDVAIADALYVSEAGALQQPVLAGVQRQQQIAHPAGVVDGLAEHRALFLLHALHLQLLAEGRPQPALLCSQLQGTDFPAA